MNSKECENKHWMETPKPKVLIKNNGYKDLWKNLKIELKRIFELNW